MNFEKHVISELKNISEKLDIVNEQTARQDERIKQNTKNIDSQNKKIWGIVATFITTFIGAIVAKFMI